MKRKKTRGAALVEAALVLPTLAIFLGLTMYEYRSYREKMHVQQTTRMNSLYYASHGCQGESSLDSRGMLSQSGADANSAGGANGSPYGGLETGTSGNGAADKVINKGPPNGEGMRAATSRSFNWATSTMTSHAEGGSLSRDVHGKSFVFCNERPEDGDPVGVVKWAFTFFRTGLL
jgi:Flp pilus assembly protein TadG